MNYFADARRLEGDLWQFYTTPPESCRNSFSFPTGCPNHHVLLWWRVHCGCSHFKLWENRWVAALSGEILSEQWQGFSAKVRQTAWSKQPQLKYRLSAILCLWDKFLGKIYSICIIIVSKVFFGYIFKSILTVKKMSMATNTALELTAMTVQSLRVSVTWRITFTMCHNTQTKADYVKGWQD